MIHEEDTLGLGIHPSENRNPTLKSFEKIDGLAGPTINVARRVVKHPKPGQMTNLISTPSLSQGPATINRAVTHSSFSAIQYSSTEYGPCKLNTRCGFTY